MRGFLLCSLLLAGLVLIFARMNQENAQFNDQPKTVFSNINDSGKKNGHEHAVSMAVQKKDDAGYKAPPAELETGDYESQYGPLPGSLRGTRMDGDLLVDAENRLIILPSIRKRFDYFLSAVSEDGLETAIGRIEENIFHSLPPEAAEEALDVLYSYINYKKGLQNYLKDKVNFPENSEQVTALRKIIEKRMELRRKYMAQDVVDSFFGNQELYDEFSLKRLEVHYDKSLTSAEKQNKLTHLRTGY